MGRRTVAGYGGDSSPSSAESSFRELDDVFLQTQTRMWLEEILGTRLDEDLHVSELLQDGELLFEVSKIIWNLLLTKCVELKHLKGKYGPFASKKSSGRYKPYSNVDSFLKICKILGLGSVDLLSPSDVVEKRDIRKVCICLRALSKKARSKQLSVPDFDMVMYSVSMPTDMVGYIRRSLELSQPTLSSSSGYCSPKGSQMESKQTKPCAPCDRNDDSCSDDSDEAESAYMGENSFPPPRKADYAEVSSVFDPSVTSGDGVIPAEERRHELSDDVVSEKRIHRRGRNVAVENDGSDIGDSSCMNRKESNYIADYLAFSDLMIHGTDDSDFLDGENHMFDFFLNADSQGLTSDKTSFQRKFSDDDEMEVSSTTSMSSVLGRVLNLELDYQLETDENVYSSESLDHSPEERFTIGAAVTSEMKKLETLDELEAQSRTQSAESFTPSHNVCSLSEIERSSDDLYGKNSEMVGLFDPVEVHLRTQSMESFSPSRDICLLSEMEFLKVSESMESNRETVSVSTTISASDSNSDLAHCENPHLISSDFVCNDSNTKLACSYCCESGKESHERCCGVSKDAENRDFVVQDISCTTISDNMKIAGQEPCNIRGNDCQRKKEHGVDSSNEEKSSARVNRFNPAKFVQKPLVKTLFKSSAIVGAFLLLLHINKNKGSNAQESRQNGRPESRLSLKNKQTGGLRATYPTEKIKLG